MRNQTLRGITSLILVLSLILPSIAWSKDLEPPQWTDCTVDGEQFACLTPAQLKYVLKLYLEAKKSSSVVLLLETQLKLSDEINDSLTAGIEKLVVQGEATNTLLVDVREDLIRQDVDRMDVGTLVLYIGGAVLVGFAGGAITTLLLTERK